MDDISDVAAVRAAVRVAGRWHTVAVAHGPVVVVVAVAVAHGPVADLVVDAVESVCRRLRVHR